jgi:DNA-directed RNA polymerase II subunit RPB1
MDYKLNRMAFDYVITQIKHRFYDAIAHPSEMVGVVAAQSIGEPATQIKRLV